VFPARRIAPHIGVVVLILTVDTVAAALLLDFFDATARIGYVLTGSVASRDLFVLVVPVAAAMALTLGCPVAATLTAVGAPRAPVVGAAAAGVAAAGSAVLAVILARRAALGPAGSSAQLLVGAIAFLVVNVVAVVLLTRGRRKPVVSGESSSDITVERS
jgi:hypothetical protein